MNDAEKDATHSALLAFVVTPLIALAIGCDVALWARREADHRHTPAE